MRKNLIISIMVMIIILVVGCNSVPEEKKETVIPAEMTEFNMEQYRSNTLYSVAPSVIEFKDMQRPDNNTRWIRKLHISYPMVYNIVGDNWEKEKRINKLIMQELDKKYNFVSEVNYVDVNIDYKLYDVTEKYMSIVFYGYYQSPQEHHDVHLSVNIDFIKEEILDITDIVDGAINLLELFNEDKMVLLKDDFGGMNDLIYEALEVYSEGFPHRLNKYDFYLDGDYIGLIVTANRDKTHMSFGILKKDFWLKD